MLSVQLLGERRILDGSIDVSAEIQYRKGWALLGYLAVESGRRHSREHLADLLWPNLPPVAARTNLRQVVANLNRVFDAHGAEGLLDATREDVALQPCEAVAIDLHALQRAASLAPGPELLALAEASPGFGGDFLGGLLLDDCPDYDAWRQPVAARLAKAAARVLRDLHQAQQAAGLGAQAIASARRLVALEPWDEAHCRLLMGALSAAGAHDEALAAFERLERALRQELGRAPALATLALRDVVRAAREAGSASNVFPSLGATAPAGARHWTCGIVIRVAPPDGDVPDALLRAVGDRLQAAGARLLHATPDTAYAAVVAEGRPGSLNTAAAQAARLVRRLLDELGAAARIALHPGLVHLTAQGNASLLGNPVEWATQALQACPPGDAVVCEGLFENLFETFALHPHTELPLADLARPCRVWRLGNEGESTPDDAQAARGWTAEVKTGQPPAADAMTLRLVNREALPDEGMAAGAWLTVVQGADRGKRASIDDRPVVIGRSADSDLHLPRRTVSRHHCVVWRDGEHYRVRDLGATNRTAVNGVGIRDVRLSDGDLVTVGECTLRFGREV